MVSAGGDRCGDLCEGQCGDHFDRVGRCGDLCEDQCGNHCDRGDCCGHREDQPGDRFGQRTAPMQQLRTVVM